MFKNIFKGIVIMSATVFGWNMNAMAAGDTCCVCQIDRGRMMEEFAYRRGCGIWLNQQSNCKMKKTIYYSDRVSEALPSSCDGGVAKVGFVGHWYGSGNYVSYLQDQTEGLMKDRGMSVEVDNTACSAMVEPTIVQDYVKSLRFPNEDQYITVKGNQNISIGMWTVVAFKDANFWASVSSKNDSKIEFPKCSEFREKRCFATYQANSWASDSATCINDQGEQEELSCQWRRWFQDQGNGRVIERNEGFWLSAE